MLIPKAKVETRLVNEHIYGGSRSVDCNVISITDTFAWENVMLCDGFCNITLLCDDIFASEHLQSTDLES